MNCRDPVTGNAVRLLDNQQRKTYITKVKAVVMYRMATDSYKAHVR
jgi:hypothetical protein